MLPRLNNSSGGGTSAARSAAGPNPYCVASPQFHPDSQLNENNVGKDINATELRMRLIAELTTKISAIELAGEPNSLSPEQTQMLSVQMGIAISAAFAQVGIPAPSHECVIERAVLPGSAKRHVGGFHPEQWQIVTDPMLVKDKRHLVTNAVHESTHAFDLFLLVSHVLHGPPSGNPEKDAYARKLVDALPKQVIAVAEQHPYRDSDGRIDQLITGYQLAAATNDRLQMAQIEVGNASWSADQDAERQGPITWALRQIGFYRTTRERKAKEEFTAAYAAYANSPVEQGPMDAQVSAGECLDALRDVRKP